MGSRILRREHFQNVNRVIQRMKYAGGTFSGYKSVICATEITIIGHRCTYNRKIPKEDRVDVIEQWGPCKDVSNIRAFMGTVGVFRNYIKDYAKIGEPIQKLVHTNIPWEWGDEQNKAQDILKHMVRNSPALLPINYTLDSPVVLAIDTSWKAVGYYVYQEDPDDPIKKNYARFGSITLNEREARFSQPKRELYRLMHTLDTCKYWLLGVRKLVVETDAKYIKGMLMNPSLGPNATINRWIDTVLMYHFTLLHQPGKTFGPDSLSRRDRQPGDEIIPNPEEGLDNLSGTLEFLNLDPEDEPLDFESFKHDIDTRGGYIQILAHSIVDFKVELNCVCTESDIVKDSIGNWMKQGMINPAQVKYLAQLVNVEVIPNLEERFDPKKQVLYQEKHRTETVREQDERLFLIKKWLADPLALSEMTDKEYWKFAHHTGNFFLDKEGRLYRKNIDCAHQLVVDKEH